MVTFPIFMKNDLRLSLVNLIYIEELFMKPRPQERGNKCEEYRERGKCSLRLRGMLSF